jgi:predicted DNA-binding WGR domain protein
MRYTQENVMSEAGEITVISMDHKGGTKSCYATLVWMENGHSTTFYRYGKTGAAGTSTCDTFAGKDNAMAAFQKKCNSKRSGGYVETNYLSKTFKTLSELKAYIGPQAFGVLRRSSSVGLSYLHADFVFEDIKVKEIEPNLRENEARERHRRNLEAKAELEKLVEAQRGVEEAEKQKNMRETNKNWGLF